MNTPKTTVSPELAAALGALKARNALKSKLQSIGIAIAEQQGKLAQARAGQPSTEGIEAKRRVLYGASAIGEVTQAERDKRETELNAELLKVRGSVADVERQIEPIELAISELSSRREKDEVALAGAEEQIRASCVVLLRAEAESLCAEYVSAALQLKDRFMRINVIHDLIAERQGGKGGIRGGSNSRFYVPAFHLPQCAPHLSRPEASLYTAASSELMKFDTFYQNDTTRTPEKVAVREAEMARLRELGIEL